MIVNNINSIQVGYKSKKFSVLEIVDHCLDQIKSQNPRLNALLTVCAQDSRKNASQADHIISKEGKNAFLTKPLLGVPLIHKDLFMTKGIPTTAGSKMLENYLPPYDATVVSRLKQAGAITLGKANLDAWAHGSSGENSDFGPTRHPLDQTLVSGGSSSGSAASVAAGFAPIATGTDTGGSIRLPAAFCGVVGLKPSYGRVSRYGIIAMSSSCDSIGHFSNNVADSARLLKITAGQDLFDATTPAIPVPDYPAHLKADNLKGIRLGLPIEYFELNTDKRIGQLVKEKAVVFQKAGAEVVEVSLPHTKYALPVYYIIVPAEVSSNLARFDGIRFGLNRRSFGAEAKRRIMLGTYILSAGYYDAYYLKAMKVRTLIVNDFKRIFKQVSALIAPVTPNLPFKIGEKASDPLSLYIQDILTVPANLAGLPALAVPAGRLDGLPVGLQLIGPQFGEETLFKLGQILETNV